MQLHARKFEINGEIITQDLMEHLEGVANKSSDKFQKISNDLKNLAYYAGLLHDIGKAKKSWQKYLNGQSNGDKVFHSSEGARAVIELLNDEYHPIVWVIQSHHTELKNLSEMGSDYFYENSKHWKTCLDRLFPGLEPNNIPTAKNLKGLKKELAIRILYSVLVDSDRLDAQEFEQNYYQNFTPAKPSILSVCNKWSNVPIPAPDGSLVSIERKYFRDIVSTFIDKPKACYRLIGATGVGKTLSSLNFALEHCQHHNMDGLIYVAPYKSIIDQTAKIYRQNLGNNAVLEHHSDFVPKPQDENDYHLSCQRWDYPVIVTTAVQFFESIFSNKASQCRKLQGLLNKVILIDEYQTIPPNLIESISDVLNGLVEDYGCTVVLMSATAPNLTGFNLPHIDMVPQSEVNRQFEVLQRCEYEFKDFDYQEIANYPGKKLMIVNTTKKAFDTFQYFDSVQPGQWLHLSSRMCVAHRKELIQKLKTGKFNCVSTQIVEAGIDIDYPTIFTEECPFDSLIQRGGRCNREGKLKDNTGKPLMGKVFILKCENYPGGKKDLTYKNLSINTTELIKKYGGIEFDNLSKILSDYFSDRNSNNSHEIQNLRKGLMFKDVDKEFNVIESEMPTVLCEWGDGIKLINQLKNYPTLTPNQWKQLQQFTATISPNDDNFKNIIEYPNGMRVWISGYDEDCGAIVQASYIV